MELTWLGHSAFHIEAGETSILVDPFFTGNGTYPAGYEDRLEKVDAIALTHGHADHIGDTARLARKYSAAVVAAPEVCGYLKGQGCEAFQPMNIGGTVTVGAIALTMVQAFHSSSVTAGEQSLYMGEPAGFVIRAEGRSVYHAGDTGIFSDMALIQRLYKPQTGLIPIGDRYTMGPEEAAFACNEFLDLETIIPIHWGTFPALNGTPDAFRTQVRRGRVLQPAAGEPIDV